MTDRERQEFDDRLAEDAQRRYERMTERDRQRYLDDLQNEQRPLGQTAAGLDYFTRPASAPRSEIREQV